MQLPRYLFIFLLTLAAYTCSYNAIARKGDAIIDQIPVLCYHQVRDWTNADGKAARTYIMPVSKFRSQMAALREYGYHPVLADDIMKHYTGKTALPVNPILISFDDGTLSQYEHALPILQEYGFKAIFFIMTITIGKKGYMGTAEIKDISGRGNQIGCHTWDHHKVTGYTTKDWNKQLIEATALLEKITGKPIKYFAYPYGVWNHAAVEHLASNGYVAAFQLYSKYNDARPQYTIRRIIADSKWSNEELIHAIRHSFTQP